MHHTDLNLKSHSQGHEQTDTAPQWASTDNSMSQMSTADLPHEACELAIFTKQPRQPPGLLLQILLRLDPRSALLLI